MRDDEFFEGIINGLARAEKEIYDLDTCEYEVSKKKQKEIKQSKKKKKKEKKEHSIWYLWDNSKPSDIRVITIPGEEEKEKWAEGICEGITANSFPKFMERQHLNYPRSLANTK